MPPPRRNAWVGAWVSAGLLCAAAPAEACQLAIVLAIDVSSSVSAAEYRLQARGHALAFRDEEVIEAILTGGGARAVMVHWSGAEHHQARTGWTALEDRASILAFADELAGIGRRYDTLRTALGSALDYLGHAWTPAARACARRVVDVSGDGVNNDGAPVGPARARLLALGVTINAVVVANPLAEVGAEPDPVAFYRDQVIGGPGAFYEVARGYEDYARAFRRKLLHELRGSVAAAPPVREDFRARPLLKLGENPYNRHVFGLWR